MGRNKGDGARSKSRSSSSSLAASLAPTPVISSIGFGGFVGGARVDVPVAADGEHLQDVDGDAFLHLKRLSKKDPTTKLKALAALTSLFSERPASEVSILLPAWVFEYKKVGLDNSRQVRLSTHVAMASLATCVGRGLAPHLRSLMGTWWIVQFDPFRDVAEAAKTSFQVAFSEQRKRWEALVFCEHEILSHIEDNLKQTPQTLSDKTAAIEEATEKYERVVSCSLLALAALIDILLESSITSSADSLSSGSAKAKGSIRGAAKELCWNHKFLQQFLKSKSASIRAAAYQVLRSYIQNVPEVFREEDMEVAVPTILGTFTEKDRSCHQSMWDMIVLFTKAFPQAWELNSVKKAVIPGLWGFLQHGCYGSKQISYPYLLPLVSMITPKAIMPARKFLLDFFSKLWQGMPALAGGLANCTALLKALKECLIWTVLNSNRYCEEERETADLQFALVENVLTKLLLDAYISRNISTADVLADLALYGKARDKSGAVAAPYKLTEEVGSCVVQIVHSLSGHGDQQLEGFWDEFQRICLRIIEEAGNLWKDRKENDLRVSRIAEFFHLLKDEISIGENAPQWPLKHAVRPFVGKAFPAIQAKENPESIKLMATLISLYDISVFSPLSMSSSAAGHQGDPGSKFSHLDDEQMTLQYFKASLVPWCLDQDNDLTATKAKLALAFIDARQSKDMWEFVLSYITGWQDGVAGHVDVNRTGVLGALLDEINEQVSSPHRVEKPSGMIEWWKSPKIDVAALRIASSESLSNPACLHFLRTVLGGLRSEQVLSAPFVSEKAAVAVLESLFLHQVKVLPASTVPWIRSAPSLLMDASSSSPPEIPNQGNITDEHFQLAKSAISVLRSCIGTLPTLQGGQRISGGILSVMFCLKWASLNLDGTLYVGENDSSDDQDSDFGSEEEFEVDDIFSQRQVMDAHGESQTEEDSDSFESGWSAMRESLVDVWPAMSPTFGKSFSALTRFGVRDVLINCLRHAVLDEKQDDADPLMIRKCAKCAHEVMNFMCTCPDEVSASIDSLILYGESWPQWLDGAISSSRTSAGIESSVVDVSGSTATGHDNFVAFVDHLCKALGPREMFLHSLMQWRPDVYRNDWSGYLKGQSQGRAWLAVELLCTWEWPGGSALQSVLPFLWSLAGSGRSEEHCFLWEVIQILFRGASNSAASAKKDSDSTFTESKGSAGPAEPFLRALSILFKGLLEKEDGWGHTEARDVFRKFVVSEADSSMVSKLCDVRILPPVLALLMPILRKGHGESVDSSDEEEWQLFLQTVVSVWIQKALTAPPLALLNSGSENSGYHWILVAVSCFPLHRAGGAAAISSASSASVTPQETALLLALLRKQFSREALAGVAAHAAMVRMSEDKGLPPKKTIKNLEVDATLAKLVSVAVAYSWADFEKEEWISVLQKLRTWLQDIVVQAEEFTEVIASAVRDSVESGDVKEDSNPLLKTLESLSVHNENFSAALSGTAVSIYSLLKGLSALEEVDQTGSLMKMKEGGWSGVEMRALEDILRMFLAIGLAECMAGSSQAGESGAMVVASRRLAQSQLWDSVADVAIGAPVEAREASVRAVDLWGVGKGAISAVYALLFSPLPSMSLQWVAYQFLSTQRILDLAITQGTIFVPTSEEAEGGGESDGGARGENDGEAKDEEAEGESRSKPPALVAEVRPELARVLQMPYSDVLHSSLTSSSRVSFMLGWALIMTRLKSLTALSPIRERLVQYIQDSDMSSTLLDCLFQYIELEPKAGTSRSRRRNAVGESKVSRAAAPASRAAASGSVAFAVEGLWPVDKESVATLAGALYGLMLLVLPACVRLWFTGLRDKSLASAVEAFTTAHCSPQLLANEFAQVQASVVDDESLSIKSNRSQREVTAIYNKEDAGIDVIVRIPMPACYPLRAGDVEFTRRMGISEALLRKWELSMAAFLRNQNGAVVEAILVWKKNIDREFEGVEECPICYSIIHTLNYQLPKLACKTCRHKFHSACLYKWFTTSHQSTCPLCKTPF